MKRHGVDLFSLVFGVPLTLLGVLFLFTRADVDLSHLRWVWPLPLIALGALVIVLAVRGEREDPKT